MLISLKYCSTADCGSCFWMVALTIEIFEIQIFDFRNLIQILFVFSLLILTDIRHPSRIRDMRIE
jgi:hypothetical protein